MDGEAGRVTDLREALELTRGPIERGRGLPNAFYTDPERFREEAEKVFGGGWAALGFAADAPEPGDARPIEFVGWPLLLVHGRDGEHRVFHNVCRHRGMKLVEKPTRLGPVIRCPYHAWCYGLDGRLKKTPHVGGPRVHRHEAVDPATLGLFEVRSRVWFGVVFVDLSGAAPAFEDWSAPIRGRWGDFDLDALVPAPQDECLTFDVACNWKLAVENYCEAYHLPFVHPGLNSYSRLEDHYCIEGAGPFSGQGTRVYAPALTEDGARLPSPAGLPAAWDRAGEYVALYPNVLLGIHRDHAYAIVIEPHGLERTVERLQLFYFDEAARSLDFAAVRTALVAGWRQVFEEDVWAVEGLQRGRHAPAFDGGVFSPVMDGPTRDFHAWIAGRLLG